MHQVRGGILSSYVLQQFQCVEQGFALALCLGTGLPALLVASMADGLEMCDEKLVVFDLSLLVPLPLLSGRCLVQPLYSLEDVGP